MLDEPRVKVRVWYCGCGGVCIRQVYGPVRPCHHCRAWLPAIPDRVDEIARLSREVLAKAFRGYDRCRKWTSGPAAGLTRAG